MAARQADPRPAAWRCYAASWGGSGFKIQEAALVTGHKDWKMLKSYTHLPPENLHAIAAILPGGRSTGFEFPLDGLDDED